jgi:hypothetical protein
MLAADSPERLRKWSANSTGTSENPMLSSW